MTSSIRSSKQEFDDLVSRIRSGEDVTFGQVEKLYAQTFLESFLKHTDQRRTRAIEKIRKEQEEEGEFDPDNVEEILTEQLDKQEINHLKTVVETLGIKPSIAQLSGYVQRAVNDSDWKFLSNVLSLSSEGSLGKNNLETIAVGQLENGSIESFRAIKEQFSDTKITQKDINPVYERLVLNGNIDKLNEVLNETKFEIPEDYVQRGYESYLDAFIKDGEHFRLRNIDDLKKISRVQFKKTKKVKDLLKGLGGLFSKGEVDSRNFLEFLNRHLNLYSDAELSEIVQKVGIESGNYNNLEYMIRKSGGLRVLEEDIRSEYSKIEKSELQDPHYLSRLVDLIKITRVKPKESMFSRIASKVLTMQGLEEVEGLIEVTGLTPKLDREAVRNYTQKVAQEGRVDNLEYIASLGSRIDKDTLQLAAECNVKRQRDYSHFDEFDGKLGEFCEKFKLKLPKELGTARMENLVRLMSHDYESATKEFQNPLSYARGNKGKNKKFTSKFKKIINDYSKLAKDVRRNNTKAKLSDSLSEEDANRAGLFSVYRGCLEVLLIEGLKENEKPIGIKNLTESFGLPLEGFGEYAIEKALYSHVINNRYTDNTGKADGLLDRLNKEDLPNGFSEKIRTKVALDLMRSNNDSGYWIKYSLEYFKRISNFEKFPEYAIPQVREALISRLGNLNLETYETIKDFSGLELGEIKDYEKEKINHEIIETIRRCGTSLLPNAEKVVGLTGIKPQATREEMNEIINGYFCTRSGKENYRNNQPSKIAKFFNQELDREQIIERYMPLLRDGCEWAASALLNDTGIKPSDYDARLMVNKFYAEQDKNVMRSRIYQVFGINLGVR